MKEEQVPPGIISFRTDVGNVHTIDTGRYEQWCHDFLETGCQIHEIEVNGVRWKVSEKVKHHFGIYIIETFHYNFQEGAWWFTAKNDNSAERLGWQVSSLSKLPSSPDKEESFNFDYAQRAEETKHFHSPDNFQFCIEAFLEGHMTVGKKYALRQSVDKRYWEFTGDGGMGCAALKRYFSPDVPPDKESVGLEEAALNYWDRNAGGSVSLAFKAGAKWQQSLPATPSGEGDWECDQWKPEMVGEYTDCELSALLNKHKIMPTKEYHGKEL